MYDQGPTEVRIQPHSIESEQAILGALLLDNSVYDRVAQILEPEHFYDPVHAHIFKLIKHFVSKDKLASPITLKGVLGMNEGFKELGGTEYLVRLVGAVVTVSALPEYARMVRDLWARRKTIEVAEQLIQQATDFDNPDQSSDTVIDIAEGELAELRTSVTTSRTLISYAEAMEEGLNLASQAHSRGGTPEISSGIEKIDDLLGGLQRGRFIVLGGRTAMGKTALALALAGNVADQGHGVLMGSFEMPPFEIAQRYASATSSSLGVKVAYRDLSSGGKMDDDQFRKVIEHGRDTQDRTIQLVGEDHKEIGRLRAAVRMAARHYERQGKRLGLIVVDYIQLLRASHTNNQVENVSYCARDLKSIAKTYDVPVIGLSQVKREVDDRKDRRPGLSDLRWAGEIEEAADQVMFVYRQSYYDERDAREKDDEEASALKFRADKDRQKMEVLVEKNRGGPTGSRTIWADLPTNRICNENPANAPDPRQSDMEGFR